MCQTVWIQIRTDVLSVLIWVQTVCKCYQQTTIVAASEERVNNNWKDVLMQPFIDSAETKELNCVLIALFADNTIYSSVLDELYIITVTDKHRAAE